MRFRIKQEYKSSDNTQEQDNRQSYDERGELGNIAIDGI